MSRRIGDLRCGEKIRFGAYCVKDEGAHKVRWIKTTESDTVFLTERIEDLRCFDAREPDNPNDNRGEYGNNRYSVSNIDQFLNSASDNWFTKRHEYDVAPVANRVYDHTPYNDHPGFLAFFEEWELDALLDTEVVVAIPRCDGEEKSEVLIRKVFLPSITNIFGRTIRDTYEGEHWDYFKNHGAEAQTTIQVVENTTASSKPNNINDNWYYLLRSPNAGNSYGVRCVDRGGDRDYCSANRGILGVRPALRINPEILVSDEPDDEGYYEVIQSETQNADVSADDLFALLFS